MAYFQDRRSDLEEILLDVDTFLLRVSGTGVVIVASVPVTPVDSTCAHDSCCSASVESPPPWSATMFLYEGLRSFRPRPWSPKMGAPPMPFSRSPCALAAR
ncbi:hypothetical protein EON66_06830, partial [archaeon]